ncbi:MAG TPA: phage holin family protein [Chitinophagaceae bacterium]|jgi:hypothetical protein
MSTKQDFFADSRESIEKYIHSRLLLIRLQAVEKISKLAAAMFSGLLIGMLGFFVILFLSVMAAWYFGQLLDSPFKGFGIICAFYVVTLILVLVFRKRVLQKTIINTVISIIFEQTSEEKKDDTNTSEQ